MTSLVYEFDEIMEKIGNNNKFQKISWIILFLSCIVANFFNTMIGILTVPPSYKCKDENNVLIDCSYQQACLSDYKEISYNPPYSIITKLNLECEEFLTSSLNSLVFVGVFLGLSIFDINTKLFGRRITLIIWLIITSTIYLLMIVVNVYYGFVVLVIILASGSSIIAVSGYLLMIEMVSINKRSVYGSFMNMGLPIGALFYLSLLDTIGKINIVFIINSSLSLITGILIWLYLCDSPRLIMLKIGKNGDQRQLIETLSFISRRNNIQEIDFSKEIIIKIESVKNDGKMKEVFINQSCIFFILCFTWFIGASIYYGCGFYLRKQTQNIILQGYAIYIPDIFSGLLMSIITNIKIIGRKRSYIGLFLLGLISAFMKIFFDNQNENIFLYYFFLILLKFSISGCYTVNYTYTSEIYPTSVRNKAFSINSMCSRFGGVITPYITSYLGHNIYVYFSLLSLLGLILVNFLEETIGKNLKECYEINKNDINITESLVE